MSLLSLRKKVDEVLGEHHGASGGAKAAADQGDQAGAFFYVQCIIALNAVHTVRLDIGD